MVFSASALIKKSVGNNLENDERDVLRVKDKLAKQGLFDQDNGLEPNGYITRELDTGIKAFQKRLSTGGHSKTEPRTCGATCR